MLIIAFEKTKNAYYFQVIYASRLFFWLLMLRAKNFNANFLVIYTTRVNFNAIFLDFTKM